MEILRKAFLEKIDFAFRNHQAVGLLGPRQCGKTALSQAYINTVTDFSPRNYFDLEDAEDLNKLYEPKLALSHRQGLIVLDEIQRFPELFPALRVLIDDKSLVNRFLILGSASRDLIKQASETLAGRIRYVELTPFQLTEVDDEQTLWRRGGFPKSYLAKSEADSYDWRQGYISTFLERDIPNLGFAIPAATMRRFWLMLTHYHAGHLNASELGRSLGISDASVKRYLDILEGTFMVRQLKPWYENISKRQVKQPKIYFRDSGIYHALLGIRDEEDLFHHPSLGSSWEGFAIETLINSHQATSEECYFWAIHQQAELDLLIVKDGKRLGFEVKYSLQPKVTRSMRKAQEYLNLNALKIVTPGKHRYPLASDIEVVGIDAFRS